MPYMQRVRITKDTDLDDNSVWRYKLPSIGKYTAFQLKVESQRGNTRTLIEEVHPIESCVSKIEMLAGGARALLSLTGTQIDALNYWDFKRPNPRRYRQEDLTGNQNHFFLTGGRGLYDRQYGWDMERLGETYLEYTYDLGENDMDYFEANQHQVTLFGYRWMGSGVPNFSGYFRTRQLAAWETTAEDALKTIAIPVGNPVRRIGVQSKSRLRTIGSAFSRLEVRCNEGEYSPIIVTDMLSWTLAEVVEYGLDNEGGGIEFGVGITASEIPRWWGYFQSLVGATYGPAVSEAITATGITPAARVFYSTTGDKEIVFTYKGFGFQKCLRLGFDHDPEGQDLLDTRALGSLDLLVTETDAGRLAAMFVQDIISY